MRTAIEGLDLHVEIYPGWTLKEVLAHITGWDDAAIASLHAHLADDVPLKKNPLIPDEAKRKGASSQYYLLQCSDSC